MGMARKCRFTNDEIAGFLKQAEEGVSVDELCRLAGVSTATFYRWRRARRMSRQTSEIARLREIESENAWFKKLFKFDTTRPVSDSMRPAVGDGGMRPLGGGGDGIQVQDIAGEAIGVVGEVMRLREAELENDRLKKLLAEAYLRIEALKEEGARRR
jgi:putative transposase